MENQTVCQGEISVGPWGGTDSTEGEHWSFKAKRGIQQIIITHGKAIINTLMFKDYTDDANAAKYSSVFGVFGGRHTNKRSSMFGVSGERLTNNKIDIDFPLEFLTGVTMMRDHDGYTRKVLVSSITFHTNLTHYGPFGPCNSSNSVSFIYEGGVISGFHGLTETNCIGAIGLYIKPACSVIHVAALKPHTDINLRCPGLLPRSPGPWPGSSNSGREWDDGVFAGVKCVRVFSPLGISVISSIQFCYEKRDGTAFWSMLHGGVGGGNMEEVEFKSNDEFLTGIEGFHWPMDGMDVIRSLTFHTNKGIYGPMGEEMGTYFNSMGSKAGNGETVGFFGRSCAYLNAIGIHTEYF